MITLYILYNWQTQPNHWNTIITREEDGFVHTIGSA